MLDFAIWSSAGGWKVLFYIERLIIYTIEQSAMIWHFCGTQFLMETFYTFWLRFDCCKKSII